MIRFLADADLNEGIIGGCLRREPTMDLLSAAEARLQGLADPDVLRIAAEQDRILVTTISRPCRDTLPIFSRRMVRAQACSW